MPMLALIKLWKPLTVSALLVAAIACRATLIHQRDSARGRVASLSAQVADLQAGNQALRGAIATQNSAIADARAKSERAAALAHSREQTAARAGGAAMEVASQRAAALQRAPIDSGCDAAIRWGNAQAVELGRW
jgi:hypothetical protein